MSGNTSQEFLRSLREENELLRERERELAERNEELSAQKEELTAAIEAFIEKSDTLEGTVQKLEQRNSELDQILYRTSHDLLGPLSSIEGLMHIFQAGESNGRLSAGELAGHVLARVFQMKDVLKALGTLAHASFDMLSYNSVNALAYTRGLVDELDYLPNFKVIEFTLQIDEKLFFETDPFLFGIVLKSLISNAIIFREMGRGKIFINAAENQKGIQYMICDDGEGIDKDSLDRIFEMFYRGSVRSIGPGLGLYVVKTLLERFRGEISVTSRPGNTCFKILLPSEKGPCSPSS